MSGDGYPLQLFDAGRQALSSAAVSLGSFVSTMALLAVVSGCASLPGASSTPALPDKASLEAVQQADALYGQKKFAQAQQAFRQLVDVNPRNAYFWFRLGNCEAQLKRYPFAVEAFQNALSLDPSDGRFAYNLAFAHSAMARDAFTLARTLLPQGSDLRKEAEQNARLMEAAVGAADPTSR